MKLKQLIFSCITLAIITLTTSCSNSANAKRPGDVTFSAKPVIFEFEGMPCLWIRRGAYAGGLSCDWSKWEGEIE